MPVMTKKRPKPSGKPADRHKNTAIGFRPEPDVRTVLQALAASDQRSLAHIVEILVQEALRARGLWPPVTPKEDK